MSEIPKVLVVEDRHLVQNLFRITLNRECNLLIAGTPEEAIKLIDENPDIKIMAVDGSLIEKSDGSTVIAYAREKEMNDCQIIAMSGDDNEPLMKAGANKEISKSDAPQFIKSLIAEL